MEDNSVSAQYNVLLSRFLPKSYFIRYYVFELSPTEFP